MPRPPSFVVVKKTPSVPKTSENKAIKDMFNCKFFSFLIQKEVKGGDGKCPFC